MIGNDLVYLPHWPQRTGGRQTRFLHKVYTPSEIDLIRSLPEHGEALLWSMKEAAYKIYYRKQPVTFYAPRAFVALVTEVHEQWISGAVSYGNSVWLTRSGIEDDYLLTIAIDHSDHGVFEGVETAWSDFSGREEVYTVTNKAGNSLRILKDEFGIPYFESGSDFHQLPVSLSHDGKRLACSWLRSDKGD